MYRPGPCKEPEVNQAAPRTGYATVAPPLPCLCLDRSAQAIDELVVLALDPRRQFEVELDFLVRVVFQTQRVAAGLLDHGRNQFLTRRISEVVPDQRIAFDVELRGQLAVLVRGDEEVHMRRTVAVTTEHVQQALGRAVRRATI